MNNLKKGLTSAEVVEKQKLGKNEFTQKKKKSIFSIKECWNNKVLNFTVVACCLLQLTVLTVAPLRNMLHLATCGTRDILTIFAVAIAGTVVNAVITVAKHATNN